LAKAEHEQGGHWHRDTMKLVLLDRYHSPKLDESIVKAIMDCAQCKNFGGTHLNSLLQPITRCHPFELLVGDYLSLPVGKGSYHTAGIYLDTCSQHVWGYKFKTHRTAKAVVFDHLTLDKYRLLVSIWPASIQNLKWHIPVDPQSLL